MKRYEVGVDPSIAKLTMVERDPVTPQRDEVLVRMEASSINFHDYLVVTGSIQVAPGRVPLSDGIGVVEACGPEVREFAIGDRVMGSFFADWLDGGPTADRIADMRGDHEDGFAAGYVTMSARSFTLAPNRLSAIEAATLPCAGLTAWRAVVVESRVKPGDTVLVQGSGGVSIFALQIARMAGAQVIAISSSRTKAERLKELGATEVINYIENPNWAQAVRDASGGGVNYVVEVAGGDLTQSLRSLRVGGHLCLVGALSRQPIKFPTVQLIHANRSIGGITVGSRQHQVDMVAAINAHGLSPVIDSVYSFDQLGDAFLHLETQRHIGKIAVDYGQQS